MTGFEGSYMGSAAKISPRAVIMASALPSALAAQKATAKVPIVFVSGADPVQLGLVKSLARPDGNATGVSNYFGHLGGKRLELLRAIQAEYAARGQELGEAVSEEMGAPIALPQFFWLWAPTNFPTLSTHFDVNEFGDGKRWHETGTIARVGEEPQMMRTVEDRLGGLDILVANAGIIMAGIAFFPAALAVVMTWAPRCLAS